MVFALFMAPPRDPEATRLHIMQVTADEMRVNGYKAASLADILSKAGVSKGALYHHFSNKQELGHAVFEEIYIKEFLEKWNMPISNPKSNPIDGLCEWIEKYAECMTLEELERGCPICNISTEMSGIDEVFRLKTMAMFETLGGRLARAFAGAKKKRIIREDVDPTAVANFLVVTIQGMKLQGKQSRDIDVFKSTVKCMAEYIQSLKVPAH